MAKLYLYPNGEGDYTNIRGSVPVGPDYLHWDKVDDPWDSPDEDATYVEAYWPAPFLQKDAYTLTPTGVFQGTINSVKVKARIRSAVGGERIAIKVGLRLNGSEEFMTDVDEIVYPGEPWVTVQPGASYFINDPEGNPWTWPAFGNLQVVLGLDFWNAPHRAMCTQIYVEIDYEPVPVPYSQCDEVADGDIAAGAPVEVEPVFIGVTTADGAPDGSTLLCADLTAEPDYDGNEVGIFDGPYAGEVRVINGTTVGGTVTPDSPFSGQITAGTSFGIFTIVSGSWADVHDASVPPICDVYDSEYELIAYVGYFVGSPSYYFINRAFLYFDTSAIPATATIDEAILALFLNDKVEDNAGYATLHVVEGVQASPLECADWGNHLGKVVSGGSVAFADWVPSGYTPITLNDIGKSWINKGGITKFCLRLVSDIDDTPPPSILYDAENGISIYSAEKGVLYCPTLSLTYTVGRIWKGNIIIDQLIYQHAERMRV